MRYCPNCGSAVPPTADHCPWCGGPCPVHIVPPSPATHHAQAPHAAPPAGPRYAPAETQCADGGLTTAQYFWSLLLFAIPVLGWIFLFCWAFGSHVTPARKRLARAVLLKGCVVLLAVLIALTAFLSFFFRVILPELAYHLFPYDGTMGGYPDGLYEFPQDMDRFFEEFGVYPDEEYGYEPDPHFFFGPEDEFFYGPGPEDHFYPAPDWSPEEQPHKHA